MIKYFLNGIECNPSNKDEVEYTFNFEDRKSRELELSVDALRFVKEDYTAIKQWLSTHGRFVGMPLSIVYSNGVTVPYILDFQDENFTESNRSITAKIKRYKGMDNFFDNADGLSFGSVKWEDSDFVNIDYVIIPADQINYFITLSLGTFSLAQELVKSIKELVETSTEIIKAATPVGLLPGPDYGAIIILVIKATARIAYTLVIILALIKFGVELINLVFPIIRQFKGITVKKAIEKGCQKLGFTLQSTLLNNLEALTICPVPLREKKPSLFKQLVQPYSLAYTNGYPSVRDTTPLLGQLIEQVENMFNCRTSVKDGVVKIERKITYEQNASGQMLESFTDQLALNSDYRYNTDEIFKRLIAHYQIDPVDINTMDDTEKTVYEVSSEVTVSPGIHFEMIKGVDVLDIAFARGTRKGSLTAFEKSVKLFAKALDLFTAGNTSNKISERKNVMQISTQYFGVTKLLWMNGTRLHEDQNGFIGCDKLIENYHSDKFIQVNQKNVYDNMKVAMTEKELFNILSNNFVTLDNGRTIEILNVNWSEKRHLSEVSFSVREQGINEKTLVINEG
jgi:ribosomal protein L5